MAILLFNALIKEEGVERLEYNTNITVKIHFSTFLFTYIRYCLLLNKLRIKDIMEIGQKQAIY